MMMTASILHVFQIIFADIILSGDNALVIGMAAAGLPPKLRKRAIIIGMMAAAGLRLVRRGGGYGWTVCGPRTAVIGWVGRGIRPLRYLVPQVYQYQSI